MFTRAVLRGFAQRVAVSSRRSVLAATVLGAGAVVFGSVAFADEKKAAVKALAPAAAPAPSGASAKGSKIDDTFVLSHLSIEELNEKKKWFQENYPNGINLEEFSKLMNMTDPHLVSMIFTAIDTDNNGLIELNEWLVYASIVSKGSHDERMKFQFNVFDSNKDGVITFSELVEIIRIQLKSGYIPLAALQHHDKLWQVGQRTPEDLAMQLLRAADKNRDDKITVDEFEALVADIEALRNAHYTSMAEKQKMVKKLVVK